MLLLRVTRWIFVVIFATLPIAAAQRVTVIVPGEISPPAHHGLSRLTEALRAKGITLVESPAQADYVILAGTAGASALRSWKAPLPDAAESLTIWRGTYQGKPSLAVVGADARGLMYAALDVADRVSWNSSGGGLFDHIRNHTEKPYLSGRGVSMYTMQRAYFESRLYDE